MKIATWNLWSQNKNQQMAIEFLLALDVDIMCLQELRGETVNYIKEQKGGYFFNYSIDHYLDATPYFNGILSRLRPLQSYSKKYETQLKPRFLVGLLPRVILKEGVSFQYNDYDGSNGKKLRVFNVHLAALRGPTSRAKQLEELGRLFIETDNSICGDVNTFSKFPVNLLIGPFLNFSWKDYQMNDLNMLKYFADSYRLKLAVENVNTSSWHGYSSHLDHILIPKAWAIRDSVVHKNRYGSDHRLVVIEADQM